MPTLAAAAALGLAETSRRLSVAVIVPLLMAWERLRSGVAFDLLSARFRREPAHTYESLREHDPVHRTVLTGGWVLTRYDDVATVLRDAEGYSSDPRWRPIPHRWGRSAELSVNGEPTPLRTDGREHVEARRALGAAFAPEAVRASRAATESLVRDCLDARPAAEPFDFVATVAETVPLQVLLRVLDLPAADLEFVRTRSAALMWDMEPGRTAQEHRSAQRASEELDAYLGRQLDQRGWPFAGPVEALSRERRIALLGLVLAAGHETTTKLLGGGLELMLEADGGWAAARRHRADVAGLVRELQRLVAPVQLATRFPHADRELAGQRLGRAQQISLALGAANRDPEAYDCPHELQPGREGPTHLSFGIGPHRCPGAELATMQAEVVFGQMLDRYEDVRLAGPVEPGGGVLIRGPRRLPVVVTPARPE